LTISQSSLYFSKVGDFADLTANTTGVRWSTNAPNIVSVSDDGKIIRVGFPMLTEERRREYTKDAKKLLEEAKVAMRNARRDCLDTFKDMKKNSEISEDEYNTLDKRAI